MTITLFDKEMNYLDQGTVYHMVNTYGIDERNLRKGLKKYSVDYMEDNQEIILDEKYSVDYKRMLKENGVRISKIGNYYYSAQDIEVRDISEKDITFMHGSEHSFLIYTRISSAHELAENKASHKKYSVDYNTEFEKYLEKYKTMSASKVRSEGDYNYYKNPRIDSTKAKASFAASYETIHGEHLPWFPVKEGIYISADDFED